MVANPFFFGMLQILLCLFSALVETSATKPTLHEKEKDFVEIVFLGLFEGEIYLNIHFNIYI